MKKSRHDDRGGGGGPGGGRGGPGGGRGRGYHQQPPRSAYHPSGGSSGPPPRPHMNSSSIPLLPSFTQFPPLPRVDSGAYGGNNSQPPQQVPPAPRPVVSSYYGPAPTLHTMPTLPHVSAAPQPPFESLLPPPPPLSATTTNPSRGSGYGTYSMKSDVHEHVGSKRAGHWSSN